MLARPGELSTGDGWAFELKLDGFRAIVSTLEGLRVRSRRGWNMTLQLLELVDLPAGLVLDGELVAFNGEGLPHFPDVCRRMLHAEDDVPVVFVAFDVLHHDGADVTGRPYTERRALLESLALDAPHWRTVDCFDDGPALWTAVCELGLEGVVAKRLRSVYRPGQRGSWVKVKNRAYWRYGQEAEAIAGRLRRSHTAGA
jgi:bifunctional non-homologous end joining protein LigD